MKNKIKLNENHLRRIIREAIKKNIYENGINELQGFHGSQSNFNKFNHKKFLSSGAGSQSFGWGTYITDDVAIAADYANIRDVGEHDYNGFIYINGERYNIERDNITEIFINWIKTNEPNLYEKLIKINIPSIEVESLIQHWFELYVKKEINEFFFNENTINEYKKLLENYEKLDIETRIFCIYYLSFISFIKYNEILPYFKPKHKILYEVEIPDNNGNNYIEWYEHFPKKFMIRVLKKMSSLKPKFIQMMCQHSYPFACHLGTYLQLKSEPYFNDVMNEIANENNYQTFFSGSIKEGNGKDVYIALQNYMGSPKAASLFLIQCGFDGITYPTGTRMAKPIGAKEDGKNYVIFDRNKINIINKTDIL